MSDNKITKHFVSINNRRLHYHRCGSGPVLVLLHASACSAKVMRPHILYFSRDFTVIAPDTPGFGLSDQLSIEEVTTEDLADALLEAINTLGIKEISVYGRHTGAQIAVEFAARHPERCTMVLTDGFPIYSLEERKRRLENYLPPIVPTFDGAHLIWLWFRYREQHVFWPWNAQSDDKRADADVPDLDFLHRGVVEMLEAGDGYRIGYATAYRHRGLEVVDDLKVPVCFGGRPGDSQGHTPDMMPKGTWIQKFDRDKNEAMKLEREILLKNRPQGHAPDAPMCKPITGRSTTNYININGTQILIRTFGDFTASTPLVMLHQLPGSSALYESLICCLGHSVPVIAFDMPGHGESEELQTNVQTIDSWSNTLLSVLTTLNVNLCHLYGHNGGGAVAAQFAIHHPDRVAGLIFDAPIHFNKNQCQDWLDRWFDGIETVAPNWDGSHLLRIWHMRRDMGIWWPWFEKSHQHKRQYLNIEPETINFEVRELLKQPKNFLSSWRAVIHFDVIEKILNLKQRALFICSKNDLFEPCFREFSDADLRSSAFEIDAEHSQKASHIVNFIQNSKID